MGNWLQAKLKKIERPLFYKYYLLNRIFLTLYVKVRVLSQNGERAEKFCVSFLTIKIQGLPQEV